jgi:8-oxo-dGTP pyrophosphatase MutT (NUDIX family)
LPIAAFENPEQNRIEPHRPLQPPQEEPESAIVHKFLEFISSTPACFSRSNLAGHFTGSALVVDRGMTKVLLTHHKKLGMWLQLGGHADGNHLLHEVAMMEAIEESGLMNLTFLRYEKVFFGEDTGITINQATQPILPFDLDCHTIPESKKDQAHLHYDVRYVLMADSESLPVVSEESHDVRWFTLDEARLLTDSRSMHRQFDKVEWLRSQHLSTPYSGTIATISTNFAEL